MAKFIKNAIMLYRPGEIEIEGKMVEYKMFDQDSPSFDEDSAGWGPLEEVGAAPRRGRPPKVRE